MIIFNGAGEREDHEPAIEVIDTNAAIKAFIGDSPVLVPSIVMSSDPKLRDGERFAYLKQKGAGIFEASKESFQRIFAAGGYLARLKEQLGASESFKGVVKPGEDLSKYLKIEIVIVSHSRRFSKTTIYSGLPIWARDGQHGSSLQHILNDDSVIKNADWQPLYQTFPDAVVQSFILSCDSADVGEMIAPSSSAPNVCYCFTGLVGKGLIAPGNGVPLDKGGLLIDDTISSFGAHMKRHSVEDIWQGAENASSLNFSFLENFRGKARLGGDDTIISSIFGVNPAIDNAFDSFSWTSLESLIGSMNEIPKPNSLPTAAQRSLVSNFLGGLETCLQFPSPPSYAPLTWSVVVDGAYLRYKKTFFNMQSELQSYLAHLMDPATNSTTGATIARMMRKAEENGQPVTELFRKIETDVARFANEPTYSIGEKDARIPLKEDEQTNVLRGLHDVHDNFMLFQRFNQIIQDTAEAEGDSSAALRELRELNKQAADFHQSFLYAYFPDLVRDSFGRRLKRAKEVVEALADDGSARSVEKIQAIQAQVSCLTDVPVGPAFDKKYVLPKLSASQRVPVKGTGTSQSQNKSQQVYLIPPADRSR